MTDVPLKVIMLSLCVAPKLLPVSVILLPELPVAGLSMSILGFETVKGIA